MRYAGDGDFILVTNNASDFRQLYAAQPLHAGLVILIPAVNRMATSSPSSGNRLTACCRSTSTRRGDAHALPSALWRFLANAPAMFLILYYSMKHAYLLCSKYGH